MREALLILTRAINSTGAMPKEIVMRYVLHPGYVISEADGDRHFIGGPRLARLYGVDVRQCVYGDMPDYRQESGDIHLLPKHSGNYTLPEPPK